MVTFTLKPSQEPNQSSSTNYVLPTLEEYKYDAAIIHIRISEMLRSKFKIKNDFEFIEHPQITTDYLWNDGTHLHDTGKPLLGETFINRVSHTIELEISNKASKAISSCTSEIISLNNSESSPKEASSSSSQIDSLDAKARLTEMKSQSPDKLILG